MDFYFSYLETKDLYMLHTQIKFVWAICSEKCAQIHSLVYAWTFVCICVPMCVLREIELNNRFRHAYSVICIHMFTVPGFVNRSIKWNIYISKPSPTTSRRINWRSESTDWNQNSFEKFGCLKYVEKIFLLLFLPGKVAVTEIYCDGKDHFFPSLEIYFAFDFR